MDHLTVLSIAWTFEHRPIKQSVNIAVEGI